MEIKLNSNINEFGLYSTKKYKKGEIIFMLSGKEFDKPTRESIHVGNNKHIYDQYGIYMNHSFTPTTYIDGYNVVANVDIEPGDELNFDYNSNEINMAAPFEVNGIKVCGKN